MHHFVEHLARNPRVGGSLAALEEDGVGVGIRGRASLGAGYWDRGAGVVEAVGTTERGEERVERWRVAGHAVARHVHERLERGTAGGRRQGGEYGGESGEREQPLRVHGFDGVPHGLKEEIFTEQVDEEVPRVGGVLVAEVLESRPAKEGGGGARVRVGEAEHLLDVSGGYADVGVVELGCQFLVVGAGGQDFAEDADLGGHVGSFLVRGERRRG